MPSFFMMCLQKCCTAYNYTSEVFFFPLFVLFAHFCIFSFCKSTFTFIFGGDSVNNIVFYQKQIEKPSAKQVLMPWECLGKHAKKFALTSLDLSLVIE